MELIIEEISRSGKLLNRHKHQQSALSIGRGYQNDVILTDPHIDPQHISIEWVENNWVIFDQHSLNGCFIDEGKQSAHRHIVKSGDIIRLGKSKIRIVFPQHEVEPTIKLSPFESLIDFMKQPLVLSSSVLIFAFVAGFLFYLNQAAELNISQYIVRAIATTLGFALWPCMVALISIFTKNDARVFAQIGISFALFNLMWVSDVFESVIQFNLSSNWSMVWFTTIIPIALAFMLFWFNSYVGFHMSSTRRLVVASSLTILVFGGSFLVKYSNKPDFSYRPHYDATVLTPTFRFASSSSVDTFIKNSNLLFGKTVKSIEEDKK